ncbi:bifunctional ornithine acetyltransferase/N-acetylglutamate synthase, partial [Brachyspira pilosicoli]
MANGALENKQVNEKNKKVFLELQQKLEEICAVISKMILLDGEGMSKTIMVSVKKAKTQKDALEIASKISKSNLVKILFISNEIEHRKLLSTIGNMNVNVDKMSITVDNINIYKNGKINENQDELKILNNSLNKDKNEHHIILDCGYNTKFEDYYYFTDISQEYISIHSSYNI